MRLTKEMMLTNAKLAKANGEILDAAIECIKDGTSEDIKDALSALKELYNDMMDEMRHWQLKARTETTYEPLYRR